MKTELLNFSIGIGNDVEVLGFILLVGWWDWSNGYSEYSQVDTWPQPEAQKVDALYSESILMDSVHVLCLPQRETCHRLLLSAANVMVHC